MFIYERLDLEVTEATERRVRAFLTDNPRGKHGKHHYTFADTGLDAGEVREGARRYQTYFDAIGTAALSAHPHGGAGRCRR